MKKVKRTYDSPRRQAQAAATRQRMIRAARRLFARRGVDATSVEAVARQARVSPQLVYLHFGSKRGLAAAVIETLEDDAGLDGLLQVVANETDPLRQIRALARFNRELFSAGADLFRAVEGGGDAAGEFADATQAANERRRGGMRRLVDGWRRSGALRAGVRPGATADEMWMLTSPDAYRLLVNGCGWTPARYERWLARIIEVRFVGPE